MREENIRALLMRREYPALKVVLNSMNNVDLASLLENFTEKEYTILFRLSKRRRRQKYSRRCHLPCRKL